MTMMKMQMDTNPFKNRRNPSQNQQRLLARDNNKNHLGETKATFQEEEEVEENSEAEEEVKEEAEEEEEAEEVEEEVAMVATEEIISLTKREKTEEKSTKISLTRDGTDKMLPKEVDNLTNKLAGEDTIMETKNMEEEVSETEILRKFHQRTSLQMRLSKLLRKTTLRKRKKKLQLLLMRPRFRNQLRKKSITRHMLS